MKETLLIVDDEREICDMLKRIFTLEGYMVYTANDGEEALSKITSILGKAAENRLLVEDEEGQGETDMQGIDCILLDINMPVWTDLRCAGAYGSMSPVRFYFLRQGLRRRIR